MHNVGVASLLELLLAYQKSVNLYILYLPMNMFLPLTLFQRVEFRVIQWRSQRLPPRPNGAYV